MNLDELRALFRQGRIERELSVQDMADRMSEYSSRPITRAALANVELGRTREPGAYIVDAMQRVVAEWLHQPIARVREEPAPYLAGAWFRADRDCRSCRARVPGPAQGAKHCLSCGVEFRHATCGGCGRRIDENFAHCPHCGRKVDSSG